MSLYTYGVSVVQVPFQVCPSLTKFHLAGTTSKSVKKFDSLVCPNVQMYVLPPNDITSS